MVHWIKNHPMIFFPFWDLSYHENNAGRQSDKQQQKKLLQGVCNPILIVETFFHDPLMLMGSYLAVQKIRKRTTWSCTELWRTWIPWEAGAGWASSASTPGYQWAAQCRRCTPTVTGRRVPGRQTCPRCARLCAAERPRNSPCSAWWSPPRSLAQAWWSEQRVPRRLAGENHREKLSVTAGCGKGHKHPLLFKEKQKQQNWCIQMLPTGHFKDFKNSVVQFSVLALPSSFHI